MGRLRVRLPAPLPPSEVEDDHRTSILDSPYSATLEGGGRGAPPSILDPIFDLRSSLLIFSPFSDLGSSFRFLIFVPRSDLRTSPKSTPRGPRGSIAQPLLPSSFSSGGWYALGPLPAVPERLAGRRRPHVHHHQRSATLAASRSRVAQTALWRHA